jgi:hypothetical protein
MGVAATTSLTAALLVGTFDYYSNQLLYGQVRSPFIEITQQMKSAAREVSTHHITLGVSLRNSRK